MSQLLDEFIHQARERLDGDPNEILVTPLAVAALTVKNVALPASYQGIPIRCVQPEAFTAGAGQRVAIVCVDDGLTSALRLIRVA